MALLKQQTTVRWMADRLLFPEHHEKLVSQAVDRERDMIIDSQMYLFEKNNTLPYGAEYLAKRDEARQAAERYYEETYGTN
jgi:hypothetical protein